MELINWILTIIIPIIAVCIKYNLEKKAMGRKVPKPRQIVVNDLIDTSIIDKWKEYHFAPIKNDTLYSNLIKIRCQNCGATKVKTKSCEYCGT